MKYDIPPDQPCQKTEDSTRLLQRCGRCRMTIRCSEVTCCNGQEAKVDKEENQDMRNVAGQRCNEKREDKHCPQDHEESYRIVILHRVIATICLGNSKGRGQQSTVACIEKPC